MESESDILPLSIDDTHNIIVCLNCKTGVPIDRIVRHMKDFHGQKMDVDSWLNFKDLMTMPMDFQAIKEWISGYTTLNTGITGIPLLKGFRCTLCDYSVAGKHTMQNYFSLQHKDGIFQESVDDCMVYFI